MNTMFESTGMTVLMIEDEAPFRRVYKDIVENNGYTFLEAPDGLEGWAMIQEHHPNIVLLDMVLPGLSGLEILTKMRQDPSTQDIPVIMMTVLGDDKTIKDCLSAGADNYAVKGMFTPTEIMGMIQVMLVSGRAPYKTLEKGKRGRPEIH